MSIPVYNRRTFLVGAGIGSAALMLGSKGLIRPALAQNNIEPTPSMRGGSNNYVANAPLVDNLGSGFLSTRHSAPRGSG